MTCFGSPAKAGALWICKTKLSKLSQGTGTRPEHKQRSLINPLRS